MIVGMKKADANRIITALVQQLDPGVKKVVVERWQRDKLNVEMIWKDGTQAFVKSVPIEDAIQFILDNL